MGIYIFSWPVLRDALIKMKDEPGCDFENTLFHTVMARETGFLPMTIMAIGKMWER